MTRTALIFAAALAAAVAAPAPGQTTDARAQGNAGVRPRLERAAIRRYEDNYLSCMKCANDGVVESAIAQSVRMRWALPDARLEDLRDALATLARDGRTPAIRYKSYLAGLVFDSPVIFKGEGVQSYTWDEDLFAAVSSRAERALLGCNGGSPGGF